jgi:phosphoserine phosphatase
LTKTPLCVDLDGTLIKTDLLFESTLMLLRRKPWLAFAFPVWLLDGRAALKRKIAQRVSLRPELLPYNAEVLSWLRKEKANGRILVLATAAERELADLVANHVKLFDHVLASDGVRNLKGRKKLEELKAHYGNDFDYVGDSSADIPIWRECREAILVNPSGSTLRKMKTEGRVSRVF